jgi:hypothetical protein
VRFCPKAQAAVALCQHGSASLTFYLPYHRMSGMAIEFLIMLAIKISSQSKYILVVLIMFMNVQYSIGPRKHLERFTKNGENLKIGPRTVGTKNLQ